MDARLHGDGAGLIAGPSPLGEAELAAADEADGPGRGRQGGGGAGQVGALLPGEADRSGTRFGDVEVDEGGVALGPGDGPGDRVEDEIGDDEQVGAGLGDAPQRPLEAGRGWSHLDGLDAVGPLRLVEAVGFQGVHATALSLQVDQGDAGRWERVGVG